MLSLSCLQDMQVAYATVLPVTSTPVPIPTTSFLVATHLDQPLPPDFCSPFHNMPCLASGLIFQECCQLHHMPLCVTHHMVHTTMQLLYAALCHTAHGTLPYSHITCMSHRSYTTTQSYHVFSCIAPHIIHVTTNPIVYYHTITCYTVCTTHSYHILTHITWHIGCGFT